MPRKESEVLKGKRTTKPANSQPASVQKRCRNHPAFTRNDLFDKLIIEACQKVKYASRNVTAHYQKLKEDDKGIKTGQLENVILIYPPKNLSIQEGNDYGNDILNYLKNCLKLNKRSIKNIVLKPHGEKNIEEFNKTDNIYFGEEKVAYSTIPADAPEWTVGIRGQTQYKVREFFLANNVSSSLEESTQTSIIPAAAMRQDKSSATHQKSHTSRSELSGNSSDDEDDADRLSSSDSSSEDESSGSVSVQRLAKFSARCIKGPTKPSPPSKSSGTHVEAVHTTPKMKNAEVERLSSNRSEQKGEESRSPIKAAKKSALAVSALPASQPNLASKPAAPKADSSSGSVFPRFRLKVQDFFDYSISQTGQPDDVSIASTPIKPPATSKPQIGFKSAATSAADISQADKASSQMKSVQTAEVAREASSNVASTLVTTDKTATGTAERSEKVVTVINALETSKTPAVIQENEVKRKREEHGTTSPSQSKEEKNLANSPVATSSTQKMIQQLKGTAENLLELSDDEKEFQERAAQIIHLQELKKQKDKALAEVAAAKKTAEDEYAILRNKRRAEQETQLAKLEQELAFADAQIEATQNQTKKIQNKRTSMES